MEIKSGAAIATSWLSHSGRIKADLPDVSSAAVVYGGDQRLHRSAGDGVPLRDFAQYLAALDPRHRRSPRPASTSNPAAGSFAVSAP